MRFVCDKSDLLNVLGIAKMVVSTNNAMSIMSNVLLHAHEGGLTIQGIDAIMGIKTAMSFVDVQEKGRSVVHLDKLVGILASLPGGDVEFVHHGSKATVRPMGGKKVKFDLKCLAEENFNAPQWDEVQYFQVPALELKTAVRNTLPCISDDMARFFMCGVCFECYDGNLALVGTDGRRMAVSTGRVEDVPDLAGLIVPGKILKLVLKAFPSEGSIDVAFCGNSVYMRSGDTTVKSNLIEGTYPNYRRVIPSGLNLSVQVDRIELLDALTRVRQLVDVKSRKMSMAIGKGVITLEASSSDLGTASEEVTCSQSEGERLFMLNIAYMYDALNALQSDKVQVRYSEPMKPLVVTPMGTDGIMHVIMPMSS